MFFILTTGFYALGIFPFLYELGIILNPYKYLGLRISVLKQLEAAKEKKSAGMMENKIIFDKDLKEWTLQQMKYLIWAFIGLFTHFAIYFIVLFLLSFLATFLLKKETGFKGQAQIIQIDALISAIIIATVIIKHFF